MRKTYFLLLALACSIGVLKAQKLSNSINLVSDFENLPLDSNSYWNGADLSGGFVSGIVSFPNDYNPDWFAWNQWAYSNMTDSTTPGFENQYSAITASGYDPISSNGSNYAVAYVLSDFITTELIPVPIRFADNNSHHPLGFYVTNGTYTTLSMEEGDAYTKKFGGESGDDPDYFKLMVWGLNNGNVSSDTVEFFLADYRFDDKSEDYIVKTWEWVDLEILGDADSLMFSLESTDVGMFGMNTPAFFCIDNLTIKYENTAVSDYISQVYEYMPAPGQHINAAPWGVPSSANSIIGGVEGSLSLGAFGGYVIFSFDEPVENHPDNPYGVDFTIFGNPMPDASEPGQVYVMKDMNHNGVPDDKWFILGGSDHWLSGSGDGNEVVYVNPGGAEDVHWYDNQGNNGYIYANSIHEQPYYPDADSFPDIPQVQYMLDGYRIAGAIDSSNIAFIKSPQRAFGYADNHPRGSEPYPIPDNPYTLEIENAGGDAFDISWAINEYGNYVDLDVIHFVKVQTGMIGNLGWLGEISTEITGAVDVNPDPAISGVMDMIVIKDLPAVIDTNMFQLEVLAFQAGRPHFGAGIHWESSASWATVDADDILTATQSGELELTASLVTDPSIQASVSCTIELPSSVPELSNSLIHVYPNPANDFIAISGAYDVHLSIFDVGGKKVLEVEKYSETDRIYLNGLPAGLYFLQITKDHSTQTVKLIKQ